MTEARPEANGPSPLDLARSDWRDHLAEMSCRHEKLDAIGAMLLEAFDAQERAMGSCAFVRVLAGVLGDVRARAEKEAHVLAADLGAAADDKAVPAGTHALTHDLVFEWPAVRDLQIVALETVEHPRTISVSLIGGLFGWSTLAEIDSTQRGARGRAVALGETLQDLLESAELGWFTPEDEVDATRR